MLEFLRNNVTGFLGIAVVGVLAFAFAFSFGSQSQGWGQGQAEAIAAKVDGNVIDESTFRYAMNLVGVRNYDRNSAEYMEIRREVIQGLVERELLLDMARRAGITASSDEAEERIVNNEIRLSRPVAALADRIQKSFFMDPSMAARVLLVDGHKVRQNFNDEKGVFDLESLQKFVRHALQYTEEAFVEEQRKELIAERMRQLMVSGIRVSAAEVRASYDRENDTASVSYIRLFPSYFADRADPTPEQLASWTAENKDQIEQYYETNKYKYTNLEKMARARHILIKVAEDASDEEQTKAREEIEGLLARVKAGESFVELARQYSEDPGSGAKGGDLGFNPRGRMVPEFDEVMFTLEPGQLSGVVETKYGFHIIRLEAFREGNIELAEATPEIAEELFRRAEGVKRAMATAEQFVARLKEGATMESLIPEEEEGASSADHLRLRVRTSSPFGRNATNIPGIGKAPEIVAAAFELTPDAPVADSVFNVNDDLFVVQLKERVVPNDDDFAKQEDQLTEKLLALKQASWLRDRLGEITSAASDGGRIEITIDSQTAPEPDERTPGPAGDGPLGPANLPAPTDDPATPDRGSADQDEGPAPATSAGQADQEDQADQADEAADEGDDEATEDPAGE